MATGVEDVAGDEVTCFEGVEGWTLGDAVEVCAWDAVEVCAWDAVEVCAWDELNGEGPEVEEHPVSNVAVIAINPVIVGTVVFISPTPINVELFMILASVSQGIPDEPL